MEPELAERLGFAFWITAICCHCVNGILMWVFLFKHVISGGALTVLAWLAWLTLACVFRVVVKNRAGELVAPILTHAEIFMVSGMVMTFCGNIAFHIHTPGHRLYDLGFQLIPEQRVDSPWRPLSDMIAINLPLVVILTSFFWSRAERCQLFVDWFRLVAIVYAFRSMTMVCTSMPGPAPHCQPGVGDRAPPQTVVDIFTRLGPLMGNFNTCGDLMFSGHAAYATTTMLLWLRKLDSKYPASTASFRQLRWFAGILYILILCVLAIAGRKHYTADLVVGVLVASCSYFNFEYGWACAARSDRVQARAHSEFVVVSQHQPDELEMPEFKV